MNFTKKLFMQFMAAAIFAAGGGVVEAAITEQALVPADAADTTDAALILMQKSKARQQLYRYIFEDISMVLEDKHGNRTMRKMRRFSRVEDNNEVKFLILFDYPLELRGVALLAKYGNGKREAGVYLPAFGGEVKITKKPESDINFLGTDFSTGDLSGEEIADSIYQQEADQKLGNIDYYVIKARPKTEELERRIGCHYRIYFMRKDNLLITRTEYFNKHGNMIKKMTLHDLENLGQGIWRGNMVLMENSTNSHTTLIKINKRIYSKDYVPEKIFEKEWLTSNRHITNSQDELFHPHIRIGAEIKAEKPAREIKDLSELE